jgi:hypothetical protein
VYRSQRIGKESNNDTARIYPGCIATVGSGPGRVERRENAIAKQKRVCDICRVNVFPYDVALGVTPSSERENCAGKINRRIRPVVKAGNPVSLPHCPYKHRRLLPTG